jgi:hypothetical protein
MTCHNCDREIPAKDAWQIDVEIEAKVSRFRCLVCHAALLHSRKIHDGRVEDFVVRAQKNEQELAELRRLVTGGSANLRA